MTIISVKKIIVFNSPIQIILCTKLRVHIKKFPTTTKPHVEFHNVNQPSNLQGRLRPLRNPTLDSQPRKAAKFSNLDSAKFSRAKRTAALVCCRIREQNKQMRKLSGHFANSARTSYADTLNTWNTSV